MLRAFFLLKWPTRSLAWQLPWISNSFSLLFEPTHICKRLFAASANIKESISSTSQTHKQDISYILSLPPRDLRKLSESLNEQNVTELKLWTALVSRSLDVSHQFIFFDAIGLLENIQKAAIVDKALLSSLSVTLKDNVAKMEPFHIVKCIDIYSKANYKANRLFEAIYHSIKKKMNTMYSNEIADVVCCLARNKIDNSELINFVVDDVMKKFSSLEYVDACRVIESLKCLHYGTDVSESAQEMTEHLKREIEMMTPQEMYNNLKTIIEIQRDPVLIEDLMSSFKQRVSSFEDDQDIEQLEDPFEVLDFLKKHDLLTGAFLNALAMWCRYAVYRKPSRTTKRPHAFDLVKLHDIYTEMELPDSQHLRKAIRFFVYTKGGLQHLGKSYKPLAFDSKQYVKTKDSLEGAVLDSVPQRESKGMKPSTYLYPYRKRRPRERNKHVSEYQYRQ